MQKIFVTILIVFGIFFLSNETHAMFEDISEKSLVVMDADSGCILYNKNMNSKIYPASTTKILTAIIAIENLDLNSNITISSDSIKQIPAESSLMHFKAGNVLTVEDLLYGLLLSSGNDAAIVIAENISGSVQNFSLLMNKKAKEIGALNSNFVNPHGYYSFKHYSTPYDMALIMEYASKNDVFRKICETEEYFVEETGRTLKNTNLLLEKDLGYKIAGKTGYVEESGNVFISYALKNGNKVICALYQGTKVRATTFKDTEKIYNDIFENFEKRIIVQKSDINISYLDKTSGNNYIMGITEDINSLADKNKYILNYSVNTLEIKNSKIIGTVKINCGNDIWNLNEIYNLEMKSKEFMVFENSNNKNMIYLIGIIFCIFLILLLFNKLKKSRKNKKIKKVKKI